VPDSGTSVPHIARIYDYWLGGKDNFAADREAAERAMAARRETVEGLNRRISCIQRMYNSRCGRCAAIGSRPRSAQQVVDTRCARMLASRPVCGRARSRGCLVKRRTRRLRGNVMDVAADATTIRADPLSAAPMRATVVKRAYGLSPVTPYAVGLD
jgi:hypothetical protein